MTTSTKRKQTFRCGGCDQEISSITWTHDHVSDKTGAWIHEARRGWIHDWNGSLDSNEGGYHLAWRKTRS